VACPSPKCSGPTIELTAPKLPASANTRPLPIAKASRRMTPSGGVPAIVQSGITSAQSAWKACARSITTRGAWRSLTAPATSPNTT
jgi:hypothetical protein